MSDDYTPSTDEARMFYVFGRLARKVRWHRTLRDEFDRMIESVRTEERERIARNIVRELGEGRAADLAREGA